MPLPPLTADQRSAALAKAADARRARAELKDKLIGTERFTEPHYQRAAER